jgi:hypothetical protein
MTTMGLLLGYQRKLKPSLAIGRIQEKTKTIFCSYQDSGENSNSLLQLLGYAGKCTLSSAITTIWDKTQIISFCCYGTGENPSYPLLLL